LSPTHVFFVSLPCSLYLFLFLSSYVLFLSCIFLLLGFACFSLPLFSPWNFVFVHGWCSRWHVALQNVPNQHCELTFFWLDVIEDLMCVKKKKVAFNFQWKILFFKNNIRNLVCNGSCTFMYTFLESIFRLLATNSCKHFFYSCSCEKKVLLRFFGLNIFFRNNKVHKFYFYPCSCGQMFWI
jgi:hypothetical protein